MAITIQASPQLFTPAFNPIWSVLSSTNTAQPNFEYVCDVYVTGKTFSGGSTYLRLTTPADPTYGRGTFDVSAVLKSFIDYDLDLTNVEIYKSPNSILAYTLKFGEKYGQSSGIVVYENLTVDSTRYAWNGVLDHLDFKDFAYQTYVSEATPDVSTKWLTNKSYGTANRIPIRTGERAWLYAMTNHTSATQYLILKTYKWNDTLQQTLTFANNWYTLATNGSRMIRVPAGYNIDDIPGADVVTGSLPVITDNTTTYYKLFLSSVIDGADSDATTELAFFTRFQQGTANEEFPCTEHTEWRLHFQNKLGGFDSFTFTQAHQFSTDITRKKFEKVTGAYQSGSSYTYNKTDRLENNFYTELRDTIKLNSNWISEAESTWLEELITSPRIFHDDATHGLVPVNITNAKYTRKQKVTDALFNLEIDIQYTYNRFRQ